MIKKIESVDFDLTGIHGKGHSRPAYNAILKLKPGEAILIDKTGWKSTHTPLDMVRIIEKRFKRRYERGVTADRTAWAVKRVS